MSDTNCRKEHKSCQKSLSIVDTIRCKICPHVPCPPPNPPPRWPHIEPMTEEEKAEIKQSLIDNIRSKVCPLDPTVCCKNKNSPKKAKKAKSNEDVLPLVENPEPLPKPTKPETPSPKASKSYKKKCENLYKHDPCRTKSYCLLYPPCNSSKSSNEECEPSKKKPKKEKKACEKSKSTNELDTGKLCGKEQEKSEQEKTDRWEQEETKSCEQEQLEICEQEGDKKTEPVEKIEKTEEKHEIKEIVECNPENKQTLINTLRSKLYSKICLHCPSNVQIECPPKEPAILEPPPQPEPESEPVPEKSTEKSKPNIQKIPESERKPCIPGTPVMDIQKAKNLCRPTCEDGPPIPCPGRGQGLQSEALDELSTNVLNTHRKVMEKLSCAANDLLENITNPENIKTAREKANCIVSELHEKAKELNPKECAEKVSECTKKACDALRNKTQEICDSISIGSRQVTKEKQLPPPKRKTFCAKDSSTIIEINEDCDIRNKPGFFGAKKSSKHDVAQPKKCCDRKCPSKRRSPTKLIPEEVALTIADDAPATTIMDVVSSIKDKFCALFFDTSTNATSLSDNDCQTAVHDDCD